MITVHDVCTVARHAKLSPKGNVTGPWILYDSFTITEVHADYVIGIDNIEGGRKKKLMEWSFPYISKADHDIWSQRDKAEFIKKKRLCRRELA